MFPNIFSSENFHSVENLTFQVFILFRDKNQKLKCWKSPLLKVYLLDKILGWFCSVVILMDVDWSENRCNWVILCMLR